MNKPETLEEIFAYAIGYSIIQDSQINYYNNNPEELKQIVIHHWYIDEINILIKSCEEGISGEWDCSTDEGKEGFQAMIEALEKLKDI